jgi:hypothetical protein
MRTKKVRKSHQTFQSVGIRADGRVSDMRTSSVIPSAKPSVFVQTDTCQTCVRFGICDNLSVMPSVLDVGKAVGIQANRHVSYMRALRDVRQSVSDTVGIVRRKSRRWMWHNPVNCFATLCEISTGYSPSVYPSVNRKFFLFFYVTLSKNLELQSYSTHNTITRADH